jgi:putative transposase
VTARGNRREPIFFEDGDQEVYLDLLCEQLAKARVELWAYCLMPNHVHLILCPATAEGLAVALGAAHRRWANFVNARGRWRGHLFDGRFASVAMEEDHLIAAVRYVDLNPAPRGARRSVAVVERPRPPRRTPTPAREHRPPRPPGDCT